MVTQTREAFLTLYEMVFQHTTTIDQEGPSSSSGVQPPASSGREPSISGDKLTSHVPQSEPHVCTTCGLGPRHGTSTITGGQVRTLLKLYYCSIFNFSILYVTYYKICNICDIYSCRRLVSLRGVILHPVWLYPRPKQPTLR